MKKILWFLLELFDDNWGYTTQIQKRFEIGDICIINHQHQTKKVSLFKPGDKVVIVENGRHDYLIRGVENPSHTKTVYQFELTPCKVEKNWLGKKIYRC